MREIIFDTETTGLDAREDRIIEIGAVELEKRFVTGRHFHVYINPDGRSVHPDAFAVHGISTESLADKPLFKQILDDWFAFTADAKLIAHNAKFDVGFFNAEFARLGFPPIDNGRVIDTLAMSKRKHPMGPHSLDALCRRYGIDNSKREKHGALLDSELLAEVYIELIGGKQAALVLDTANAEPVIVETTGQRMPLPERPRPLPSALTEDDASRHADMVELLGADAIWNKYSG